MPDLFGLDLAGIVADAFAGKLRPAVLTKVTVGTRTPGNLAGGTNATTATYSTEGIFSPGSDRDFTGTGWAMTRRERGSIMLLGAPLAAAGVEPEIDDLVTIEGTTWQIKIVDRDPAAATYTMTVVGA